MHFLLIIFLFLPFDSFACTSFLLSGKTGKIMTKNYDWLQDVGYAVTNKRNVLKKAFFPPNVVETPAQWVSQYSSVTLNQYGREFPNSGMNEKGLTIEILWLDSSTYPQIDSRPAVNELQWVQYQLDNFGSTDELLSHANEIRIHNIYAKTHYFVCDAYEDCAVLEYINGNLVTTSQPGLAPKLITNDTYSDSRKFLDQHVGFGGELPIPTSNASLDRFVRAAQSLRNAPVSIESAFTVLNTTKVPNTQWQVAYDLENQEISFKTLSFPSQRKFKASINEGSCLKRVSALDMKREKAGDITSEFAPFTSELNRALLDESFKHLGALGEKLVPLVAAYPASTSCLE